MQERQIENQKERKKQSAKAKVRKRKTEKESKQEQWVLNCLVQSQGVRFSTSSATVLKAYRR